jgi:predicted outer membrane repeat protein
LAAQWSIVKVCGLVKSNIAGSNGGGIAVLGKASLQLGHGTALHGNSAGGSGGCVYAAGASTIIGESGAKPFLKISASKYTTVKRHSIRAPSVHK